MTAANEPRGQPTEDSVHREATRAPMAPPASQPSDAGLVEKIDHVADKVDEVFNADVGKDEPETVLDDTRVVRWAAPLFLVCTIGLVPWIALLAVTLPQRQLSANYDLAWTGYDVLELVGVGSTAFFGIRRSFRLPIAAAATGALLLADAWFDVMTTPKGSHLVQSILLATLFELPLALLCFWLAVHAQEIVENRILLLRRKDSAEEPQH